MLRRILRWFGGSSRELYMLEQVFGEWQDSDSPSYVDRASLDSKVRRLLNTPNVIVIHGGSKQGKTILRKKVLSDDRAIVVSCRVGMSIVDLMTEIAIEAGVEKALIETQLDESSTKGNKYSASGETGLHKTKASGGYERQRSQSEGSSSTYVPLGGNLDDIGFLMRQIRSKVSNTDKRIVLDDFHFLDSETQSEMASHLKTLQEYGVYAMVIGVWPQRQLLTTYNPQLRSEDIDLQWTNSELGQVIDRGCKALNFTVSADIRERIVADSYQSVGLLQVIMYKLCEANGIDQTQEDTREIKSVRDLMQQVYPSVCRDKMGMYKNFFDIIVRNERVREDSLRMYERIMQVCIEQATDKQLLDGIFARDMLPWIQDIEPRVENTSNITKTLQKLNELQDKRNITYLVFFYDDTKLVLVDRILLFYRRYKPQEFVYPWEQEQDD